LSALAGLVRAAIEIAVAAANRPDVKRIPCFLPGRLLSAVSTHPSLALANEGSKRAARSVARTVAHQDR
jgi:hypothetical protein